jgi:hypothetical protein
MADPCSPATSVPLPDPEVTVRETAHAVLADLAELDLPGGSDSQRQGSAVVLDRLAEELTEAATMLRALPRRPAAMSGHDYQLLAALRTAHAAGEDVGETIARALARLAAEAGGTHEVIKARPGSWEAALIAELLRGTVGEHDEHLSMWAAAS